jgi:hypothetical protein
LIRELDIPRPFSTEKFFAGVAQQRGKRIELVPTPLASGLPCGMLVSTTDVDYIVHRTDTTALHAQHTDMHELGHLLLGHAQLPAGDPSGLKFDAEAEVLHLLLPELSPRLIRRILGRTVYNSREEWEAETFASELMMEIHQLTGTGPHGAVDLADHLVSSSGDAHHPAGSRWVA